MIQRFKRMTLCLTVGISLFIQSAFAASEIKIGSFIRDAEIEDTLKDFISPLFKAANLDPKRLHVYLIMNPDVNAAAGLGASLFINTGMITASQNVGQVIGVFAHETGHIAGEHGIRTQAAMDKATIPMMAAMALGAAAGIATGRPDVGMGLMLGGQHIGEATFLHYSRGQESAADQAAVKLLKKLGWSTHGLLEFMEILDKQDLLSSRQQDPYRLTHPLTKDRITFLRHVVEGSETKAHKTKDGFPTQFTAQYDRIKAKLEAYTAPPGHTLAKVSSKDTSLKGRYMRAIALFRSHKLDEALKVIDHLIQDYPFDPYFYELKGQMLYENGRIQEALPAFRKATSLKPDAALLHIALAQAMVETQNKNLVHEAIEELNKVKEAEKDNPMVWRLLASGYGKEQQLGLSFLMLAEQALVEGDTKRATFQAERALKHLPQSNKQAKQRAQDILNETKEGGEEKPKSSREDITKGSLY